MKPKAESNIYHTYPVISIIRSFSSWSFAGVRVGDGWEESFKEGWIDLTTILQMWEGSQKTIFVIFLLAHV